MKKVLLALVAILASVSINAQDIVQEEIDYIQSVYGMEKKMIVSEFLNLDDATSEAFWGIYDAYEVSRKELGKKRIELLQYIDENNDSLTDEKADSWMKEIIKLRGNSDKLLKSYYNKVKKATNPILAARFFQIETYLRTAQSFAVQDALPVVGGQLD